MDEKYYAEVLNYPINKFRTIQHDSEIKKYRILDKEYIIEINLKQKTIRHNCLYWKYQCSRKYKLCKHIAKIFLFLFKDDSIEILKDIILNDWIFESF
ncbi:MAG: hypothetical protein ACTSPY_14915 [Candidatus Helarchaeota archaeon]